MTKTLLYGVAAVAALGGLAWYLQRRQTSITQEVTPEQAAAVSLQGLGWFSPYLPISIENTIRSTISTVALKT